jgi:hypothetical protein
MQLAYDLLAKARTELVSWAATPLSVSIPSSSEQAVVTTRCGTSMHELLVLGELLGMRPEDTDIQPLED